MLPDLGKYAFAVLSSYAVTLGLMAVLVGLSLIARARVKRQLAAYESRLAQSNLRTPPKTASEETLP